MNIFLYIYDHPKVNQVDINYLNKSITHNEIETAIKSFPKRKSPGLNRFSAEFYRPLKKK
jgi:hypothetical protein